MGAKGCRTRCPIGVEFLAQVRVIGDEGIDELHGGGLLVGLVFDKGREARLIKSITRDGGKHGGKQYLPEQPTSLSRAEEGHYRGASIYLLLWVLPAKDGTDTVKFA